jgi:LCP family protein required for cell wall assembly
MKNPFSRPKDVRDFSGVIRSTRRRPRRFSFLRHKWVIVGVATLVVVVGGAGFAAYLYFDLQGDIQEEIPTDPREATDEAPFNVLLVGSDSRVGLTETEQERLGADDENPDGSPIGGERADTLILVHIEPETEHVTMVQFPRDLYVPVPDGEKSKINETLNVSDDNLVETVRDLTGLDIHNYVKVNIAGFRDLVDAIDGVEVCIAEPIEFDPQTGIEITEEEVGMVDFDGDRALRFVRSRAFATGDFQRIQNQQKFLAAAVGKITSPATFLHFSRISELMEIARDNVTIDSSTTIKGLYDILERFRAFDPENYEAYTAPNLGVNSVEVAPGVFSSTVKRHKRGLRVMFDAIEANESPGEADGVPDVESSAISVDVFNGTKKDDAAEAAAEDLVEAMRTADGTVDVVTVTDARGHKHEATTVEHRDRDSAREKAELVAAAIPGAVIEIGRTNPGIDVAVTVGKDFDTRRIVQIVPIPIPKPAELPEECR